MGNASEVKVFGVDTVCLKTNNGSMLVLQDVKHAPDFPFNLISAGRLDDEGYHNALFNSQWKLTKDSLVVARGVKFGYLYVTQGSIFNDSINMVEGDTLSELWHRRLSHISDRGITCLTKKSLLSGVKQAKLKRYVMDAPVDEVMVDQQSIPAQVTTSNAPETSLRRSTREKQKSMRYNPDEYKFSDDDFIILLLYMDDMLIVGKNKSRIAVLKKQLSKLFVMKDLGPAKKILGIQIYRHRDRKELFLSQKQYIEKILKRFNMTDAKVISTPLAKHFKLSISQTPSTDEEKKEMSRIPYSFAVGSLMYAMVCTRPDIAHAVGTVSRFLSNPGKEHWDAVKWILRLRKCIALSTTEAEYITVTEGAKELLWMKEFINDLGFEQPNLSHTVFNLSASNETNQSRILCICLERLTQSCLTCSALDGVVNLWQVQDMGSSANLVSSTDCISREGRRWPEDVAWHPKGTSLFSVYSADGGDSQISILNLNKGKENTRVNFLEEKPHVKGIINSITFMPWEEDCFVTGGNDHAVVLWTNKDGENSWKPKVLPKEHSSAVMGVAGLQHKKVVMSAGADKRILGFDLPAQRIEYKHQLESKCMSVLPNPHDLNLFMVQTGTLEKQLRLFDFRSRQAEIHSFGWKQESSDSHSALINQAWSPDGLYISSGSVDPDIHIFDIRYNSHKPSQSIRAHHKRVFKAVWHHTLPLLISISSDLNIGLHRIL
uniref:Uncharacterized protein LOC104229622 n=1 Tax=Nicotiana sylvestris TaxID=4096 RepID=A0A1U7X286_NICSY|nr:PREDICTED: uncharacterized protein LOC104229622 [Nicotiana sylvestris]